MTTTVVLIRHAKPDDQAQTTDFMRPISTDGKAICKKLSQFLRKKGFIPDEIYCSPYTRTLQSAEILGQAFGKKPIEELSLSLHKDEREFLSKIPEPEENKTIYIVGHGPSLLRLSNRLVGKAYPIYDIDPSSAIVLTFSGPIAWGLAEFKKYITQDHLESI